MTFQALHALTNPDFLQWLAALLFAWAEVLGASVALIGRVAAVWHALIPRKG